MIAYVGKLLGSGAFSSRDYRFLWLGSISMTGGMQMQVIVRGYLVYDLTSSPLILGLVSTGFAVPMLALALFGGEIADRMPKKRIIQLTQTLGFMISLFVGISITTETITWIHLLVASLFTGAIYAFMVPSRTALIPRIVDDAHIGNAFALNSAAMSTMTLIAPAIGGNLYALIGADGVYYVIAGVQLAAVVFTGAIRVKEKRIVSGTKSVMHEIADGLRYIGANRFILILIVAAMSTALLSMPFRSLLPVYVVDLFARGPETLGLLLTLMGLGSIAGAIGIASIGKRRRGALLLTGGLLSAASLLVAAFWGRFLVISFCMVVLGLGDAFRRTIAMALIMESTDRAYQGRVASVYTMNFGLMPLGTMPASALTEWLGVRFATGVLGALLLAICSWLILTQPKLRRLN